MTKRKYKSFNGYKYQ